MIELKAKMALHAADGPMELAADLSIGGREFVTLFGKSGAGKTTLLRILAGLTRPDEGLIRVDGETWLDTARGIDLPPQRRHVGFVFQDHALFPNMTVAGNLAFALGKAEAPDAAAEALKAFGLADLAARRPDTLSGGQRQRVALARALLRKPRVLLMDEPLSALDHETRVALQDELWRATRGREVATVLVSHDLGEIFKLSDRLVSLERGRVVSTGTPAQVFGRDRLSGKFRFTGEVLQIEASGVVFVLGILVGNDLVRVVATEEEGAALRVGDRVLLSSKAFNPLILKLSHGDPP